VARKKFINKDQVLKSDPNVIIFGSVKNVFTFLISDTLIYSHAQSDIAYIQIIKLFKRTCKRVFLQHGVIAFGKLHSVYRKNHNEMDVFIVSSEFEKKIVLDNFSFEESTVKITGLARYDNLSRTPFPTKASMLYMPTSRGWAFPIKNAGQYISGIETLLNHSRLNSLLVKHDIQLNFFLHTRMSRYLKYINVGHNVNVVNYQSNTVQELLKESSLLITDYSSVAWDHYYLGKPVLFYQFDQDEFLLRKGSYIDFDSELFGEVFKDCDSLVAAIEKYIVNNFRELPEFSEKRDFYFKFRDTNNCRRIFDAITSNRTSC
jgi:CDP-glycerol glycerophosphotransferase (TagB/SpsB family)